MGIVLAPDRDADLHALIVCDMPEDVDGSDVKTRAVPVKIDRNADVTGMRHVNISGTLTAVAVAGSVIGGTATCEAGAVGTALTTCISAVNDEPATALLQQYSPTIDWECQLWNTNGGGATENWKWASQAWGISGNPSMGAWTLYSKRVAEADVSMFGVVNSAGVPTFFVGDVLGEYLFVSTTGLAQSNRANPVANGADISIAATNIYGTGTFSAGRILISSGTGSGAAHSGGAFELSAGDGAVDGGVFSITSGEGTTGDGGAINVTAGAGAVNADNINITGGAGTTGTGSDINLTPGAGVDAASNGKVSLKDSATNEVLFVKNGAVYFPYAVAAPASPASGYVMYVDVADNKLKAKYSNGFVTEVATTA